MLFLPGGQLKSETFGSQPQIFVHDGGGHDDDDDDGNAFYDEDKKQMKNVAHAVLQGLGTCRHVIQQNLLAAVYLYFITAHPFFHCLLILGRCCQL